MHEEERAERERFASIIVDSGLKVHRALGPGLLFKHGIKRLVL
jgi:hypothetical protein